MASQIQGQSTSIRSSYFVLASKFDGCVERSSDAQWDLSMEPFSREIDSCFELEGKCDTALTLNNIHHFRKGYKDIKFLSCPDTPTNQDFSAAIPRVLSPTNSISTPSSPSVGPSVWDSPQTPLQLADQSGIDLSTPLTPPMILEGTSNTSCYATQMTPSRTNAVSEEGSVIEHSQDMESPESKVRDFQMMLNSLSARDALEPLNNLLRTPILTTDNKNEGNPKSSTEDPYIKTDRTADPLISDVVGKNPDSHAQASQTSPSYPTSPRSLAISTDLQGVGEPAVESIFSAIGRRTKMKDLGAGRVESSQVITVDSTVLTQLPSDLHSSPQSPKQVNAQPLVALPCAPVDNRPIRSAANPPKEKHQSRICKATRSQISPGSVETHEIAVAVLQPMVSFKNLKTVLEHIIPFDFNKRIIDDPYQCVATLVTRPHRCRSSIKRLKTNVEAISICIKNSDYIALLDHIEELIKNTMCKRHKDVALSQTILTPRIDTLRNLVVSLPNVSEGDLSVFGTWLKALSGNNALEFASNLRRQITWGVSLSAVFDSIIPSQMQPRLSKRPYRYITFGCKESHVEHDDDPEDKHCRVMASINVISKCISKSDYDALPGHVGALAQVTMCRSHQVVPGSSMQMLKAVTRNLAHIPSHNRLAFREWIEAIAKCDLPPHLPTATLSFSPSQQATHLAQFTPFKAEQRSDVEIAKALRSKIEAPLSEHSRKAGYVYIFWDQTHFGMIKVGKTVDLEQRRKQWNSQCKTTYHYHQSLQDEAPIKMPHAHRIEQLMHLELANCRKKRTCEGCGKTHIEWFDISETKARKVLEKWRNWVMQEPYAPDHEGCWRIKPEMLDTLHEVCRPVVFSETKAKKPQPRHRRDKKRSSRRVS